MKKTVVEPNSHTDGPGPIAVASPPAGANGATARSTKAARPRSACEEAAAVNTGKNGRAPADEAGQSEPGQSEPRLERFLCPVDEAARIVGQKWTLQIVHHLLDGRSRRFCELQDALGKVNPSTLSSRLKMLEETGLVSRSQISDIPPHVEYRLTDMGAELRGVINEITRWSNAHLCFPQESASPCAEAENAQSVAQTA